MERACSPLHHVCEGGIDFVWGARLKDFNLNAECASRSLQFLQLLICLRVVRIYDDSDNRGSWHQLVQQLQSFCFQSDREQANPGGITAWTIERRHCASFDWILPRVEHDRDRRSRGLGGCCRGASPDQNHASYPASPHRGGRVGPPFFFPAPPSNFDRDVAPFDMAVFGGPLFERLKKARGGGRRYAAEDSAPRHGRLLRARRERP